MISKLEALRNKRSRHRSNSFGAYFRRGIARFDGWEVVEKYLVR